MQVTTIGLDIAKNVFQLHGVDSTGRAVLLRKVRGDRKRCCEPTFRIAAGSVSLRSGFDR